MYELKTIFPSGSPHLIHCTLYNLLFVSVQVRSLQYITCAAVQSSPWFSYQCSLYPEKFHHTSLWLVLIPASTHRQPLISGEEANILMFQNSQSLLSKCCQHLGKEHLLEKKINFFFFSLPSGWQSGFLTNSFTSLRKFTCVSKPCKRECQGECSRQSACHGSMRTRVCILSSQIKTGRGDTYLYPQLQCCRGTTQSGSPEFSLANW